MPVVHHHHEGVPLSRSAFFLPAFFFCASPSPGSPQARKKGEGARGGTGAESASCPWCFMHAQMGIQRRLMEKIPEIIEVEQVMDGETGLDLSPENVEQVGGGGT